jgi:hypothetical protein
VELVTAPLASVSAVVLPRWSCANYDDVPQLVSFCLCFGQAAHSAGFYY